MAILILTLGSFIVSRAYAKKEKQLLYQLISHFRKYVIPIQNEYFQDITSSYKILKLFGKDIRILKRVSGK